MPDTHSEHKAELSHRNSQSMTRRQTLALLGGLGGLGIASSQRVAAQSENDDRGPTVDPDSEFTIAIFPDTQYYSQQNNGIFQQMGQWVADNRDTYNIQMALHEGDIVQSYGSDNDDEWDVAQDAIGRIDEADIPTVLSLGNHDADDIRNPQEYRSRFPASRYEKTRQNNDSILESGTFEGYAENAYFLQEINDEQFLFLTLEFGPRDAAVEWGGQMLQDHSEATGILVTHTYTYHDGDRVEADDNYAPNNYFGDGDDYNNGEQMWQNELADQPNLANIHSGHHITGPYVARSTAHAEGNRTSQTFMNYQTIDNGGDGWLRLFTIDTESYQAEINTYSPHLDQWSEDRGESFSFDMNSLKEGS